MENKEKIEKFTHYKQSLLEEVGIKSILIPEDQIEPVEDWVWKKIVENINTKHRDEDDCKNLYDNHICPYCVAQGDNSCKGCPMDRAGNGCKTFDGATSYGAVMAELTLSGKVTCEYITEISEIPEIVNKLKSFIENEILKKER